MRSIYILFLALLVLLGSCKKEQGIIRDTAKVNNWVYDNINKHYLWSATIPEVEQTNMELSPKEFFDNQLRYRYNSSVPVKDDIYGDRFSAVSRAGNESLTRGYSLATGESAGSDRVSSFGIEVRSFTTAGRLAYCQVLYVLPGSQAEKVGVRRGDCFKSIDGNNMTSTFNTETAGMNKIRIEFYYPKAYSATLERKNMVDTPIVFDSIYTELGPKTGYFVYNHFTQGDSDNFTKDMKKLFGRFKVAGVRNLVIDLRYNGGGELDAARVLASLMVRKQHLNKVMMFSERNKSYNNPQTFTPMSFMTESETGGNNPDVENVYVITSEYSASASELLIHVLKPYLGGNMVVVGDKTHGKNLGGITITNKRYEWEVTVITMRVYNTDGNNGVGVSGYEKGIEPDHQAPDYYPEPSGIQMYVVSRWGDPEKDPPLNKVMSLIYPDKNFSSSGRLSTFSKADAAMNYSISTTLPLRDLSEGRYLVE